MSFDDLLKRCHERLQLCDDPLRRVAVAILGEADDIAEQHGDILVPPRLRASFRLELAHDGFGQDAVQELVHAGLLFLELLDKKAFLITQPLALERGLDARPQEIRVERLLHVIVSAKLDATRGRYRSRRPPRP